MEHGCWLSNGKHRDLSNKKWIWVDLIVDIPLLSFWWGSWGIYEPMGFWGTPIFRPRWLKFWGMKSKYHEIWPKNCFEHKIHVPFKLTCHGILMPLHPLHPCPLVNSRMAMTQGDSNGDLFLEILPENIGQFFMPNDATVHLDDMMMV